MKPRLLTEAVSILKRGGIIAYPTDTAYCLGADIFNEEAVARVIEIKGRPLNEQIPILISAVHQLNEICRDIPEVAWKLAGKFWPGGLTLILKGAPHISTLIRGGTDKVKVRVPAHPVPIAIISALRSPITGTGANLAGFPPPITYYEVRQFFQGRVDLIIEGICPGGRVSTVVDLTDREPVIIREGAIPKEEILRVIKEGS